MAATTLLRPLILAALSLILQADPTGTLVADTRALVEGLFAGRTAPLVQRFGEKMAAALPEAQLAQTIAGLSRQVGPFRAITETRTQTREGMRAVLVSCAFATGTLDVSVGYDAAGRIVALNIRPGGSTTPYVPPPYVTPAAFVDREVVVDAGGWPLPGTLSMPAGDGPFPAVVLVHGSGPGDRDESLGPNRPFRDLAEGLASRGIAVLRYDKRTRVFASQLGRIANFTVKDEVIDDALAAVALLRRTPKIRGDRVFVAGHSLGGMLAPRLGAADPTLGGLIVLAGATRSLPETLVAQTRYLAGLDGVVTDQEREQITAAEAVAVRAATMKPGDAPLSGPLASAPVSYLLDLRGFDPPAAAARLSLPMFVAQGERDYQVTMADFAAWRAALEARRDVAFRSYPALNHMLMAGTGPSSPAEYQRPGHVDEGLVRDLATWVTAR